MLARLLLAAVVAVVGSPRPTGVHVERVAGNRIDFTVHFRFGGQDRFVGYAKDGRPTWLTTCFLREFYANKLCGKPPAGPLGPAPDWVTPARFTHPVDPGLIWPGPLALAKDGSLLILDTRRDELYARSPDGTLRAITPTPATAMAVAPDGSIYLADGDRIRVVRHGTLPHRFVRLTSLAFAPDGTLYVGANESIYAVAPNGSMRTVLHTGPRFHQIVVRGRLYGGFEPDLMTVGGNGDLYVFSFSGKAIYEITPSGKPLDVWVSYAHELATAPDGSVVIGTQFGAVQRIRNGKLSTVVDLGGRKPFGFPFQEDGIAVGRDGTMYIDTFVGNGYANQTALAAVSPDGTARLLRTTVPPFSSAPCPSPDGLRAFGSAARKAAVRAAQVVDMPPFERGLRMTDPSWRQGFYENQIDGRYEIGRHHVYTVGPAASDPYSGVLAARCGASLLRDSLAVVVGPGVYSDQVSHMFFLDRNGRALLYWQHT